LLGYAPKKLPKWQYAEFFPEKWDFLVGLLAFTAWVICAESHFVRKYEFKPAFISYEVFG